MRTMGLPDDATGVRIFRRDVRTLTDRGWDIRSVRVGDEHRYRLHVIDHRIRRVFTDAERRELLRVARSAGLGGLYDDLEPDAADAPFATGALAPGDVETARYAVARRCLLRFVYHGKDRLVHPYEVVPTQDRWLLRARGVGEEVVKKFFVDEMVGLQPEPPGSADHGGIPMSEGTLDPVRFRAHPSREVVLSAESADLPDVVAALGTGGYDVAGAPALDGRVTVTVRTTHLTGLLMRMFELGPRVRLEGPAAARRAARERLAWFLRSPS
ncbi:MAG: proteasome accessory factor [Actinomycetota bacterium]|nr:proteasome accessory factor [Actinomycetota bacterium]